jgi:Protein of unknown function (DUF2975)
LGILPHKNSYWTAINYCFILILSNVKRFSVKEKTVRSESTSIKQESYRAIARIAFLAEWTSVAGIGLVAGSVGYLWLDSDRLLQHLAREAPAIVGQPSETMLLLAGAAALVPVVLLVLALWQARALFRLYRGRQIFAPDIPRILVRLGYLAFGAAAASMVARTLVILFLTIGNPPGQKHFAIGFGSNEVLGLIAGFLLCAFSLVVKESQRIADENESFV